MINDDQYSEAAQGNFWHSPSLAARRNADQREGP